MQALTMQASSSTYPVDGLQALSAVLAAHQSPDRSTTLD